jgi:uncharacterized membrane protein
MQVRWRELFSSKVGAETRWDRWDFIALALAVSIGVWVFALKLKTFYALGYSEDLFVSLQAARSWLEGNGLLHDNWSGNVLAVHTYFLLLPLGLVAKPFGAPGLLFVLAVSVGVTYFWATRILRLLGVAGLFAVVLAAVVLASPISVFFYQEWYHGFHVEDLAPALCLLLFYFLLQRRLIPSIVTGLVVVSVKEDAPIAVGMVAIVAVGETWIASAGKPARCRFNRPAAIVLLLSLAAVPLLLAISFSQPSTMYAPHSVDRIYMVKPGTLSSQGALFAFVLSNIADWLGSEVVRQWLWVMVVGSFATILLRPYYLIAGVPTTLVAWLQNQNDLLLWSPRLYSAAALLWCITLVGFASIARGITLDKRWGQPVVLGVAVAVIALSSFDQLALVPIARNAYLLRSPSPYSPAERRQADELFARYRSEGKPDEPVVASPRLFRYAQDRNLFWLNRLHDRPPPVWMLGDSEEKDVQLRISSDRIGLRSEIDPEDYTLIDRRGRFVLLRKKQ